MLLSSTAFSCCWAVTVLFLVLTFKDSCFKWLTAWCESSQPCECKTKSVHSSEKSGKQTVDWVWSISSFHRFHEGQNDIIHDSSDQPNPGPAKAGFVFLPSVFSSVSQSSAGLFVHQNPQPPETHVHSSAFEASILSCFYSQTWGIWFCFF